MELRKPLLAGAAIGLAADALLVLRGGPASPVAFVVLPLAFSALMAALAWNGARPVKGFLEGLREGLGPLDAATTTTWFGGCAARVRTAQGEWLAETWNGGTPQLWVTPPGAADPYLVQRRYREEGRRAGERARLGRPLVEAE